MDNKENCNLENESSEATKISKEKIVLDVDHTAEDKTMSSGHHGSHHHSSHHGHRSSHHGSHRSGHHRRSHKHNSKKKIKLNSKLGWALAICAFIIMSVIFVVGTIEDRHTNHSDSSGGEQTSSILNVEVYNQEGFLVKNAVNKYLLTDLLNPTNANVLPSSFANKDEGRLDAQVPVALRLSVKEGSAISYKIELATNDSFANARIYYLESSSGVFDFKHLYTNTTYYYRATVYTRQGTDTAMGHFKTADTPRILSIDGLSNVRDIGNWRTDSGKRIKQGLLIRGTEMDAAVESGYHLTNAGLVDMLEIFGIKTDIDLRAETATSKDALGPRVDHKYYDMVQYDGIFTDYGKEKIRMVFADLANPDNYPIYLHCTYGCDRTGTICYLLEALLGVSRDDCLKDYGLSNMNIAYIQSVENGLKNYEGDTLKEQVESYLLSCGVSEYQIASIRNIFLGE